MVFYDNEFLNQSENDVVIKKTHEILIHKRNNNPKYWCTCLTYELKRAKPGDFQKNGIEPLPDRQLCYENNYFEGLELVPDGVSSSDESE